MLFATSAVAEVCDKERPLWNSASGPASMLDEFLALTFNPIVLVLIGVTALAILSKRRALKWVIAFVWVALALMITVDYYGPILDDIRWEAMQEGCIGSPLLFLALAIAICAKLIHGALRPRI